MISIFKMGLVVQTYILSTQKTETELKIWTPIQATQLDPVCTNNENNYKKCFYTLVVSEVYSDCCPPGLIQIVQKFQTELLPGTWWDGPVIPTFKETKAGGL